MAGITFLYECVRIITKNYLNDKLYFAIIQVFRNIYRNVEEIWHYLKWSKGYNSLFAATLKCTTIFQIKMKT